MMTDIKIDALVNTSSRKLDAMAPAAGRSDPGRATHLLGLFILSVLVFSALQASPWAQTIPPAPPAGSILQDCPECPKLVVIPGGTFLMGSAPDPFSNTRVEQNEQPQHPVTVRPFAMGRYEVTQEQWFAITGKNPSSNKGRQMPVDLVSWSEIQDYIRTLNEKTRKVYRLPTEAEWEYAARAGSTTAYPLGKEPTQLDQHAWSKRNSNSRLQPVGEKSANGFGLHDMIGNAAEWVQDCYQDNYVRAPVDGSAIEARDCRRVVRGGSARSGDPGLRLPGRSSLEPRDRSEMVGFRLALTPGAVPVPTVPPAAEPSPAEIAAAREVETLRRQLDAERQRVAQVEREHALNEAALKAAQEARAQEFVGGNSLPSCDSPEAKDLVGKIINDATAIKATGARFVSLKDIAEQGYNSQKELRSCTSTLVMTAGEGQVLYSVEWHDKSKGLLYVQAELAGALRQRQIDSAPEPRQAARNPTKEGAAATTEVEALRKALELERQRVVQAERERDANQTALKAEQEARAQALAAEAQQRKLEEVERQQAVKQEPPAAPAPSIAATQPSARPTSIPPPAAALTQQQRDWCQKEGATDAQTIAGCDAVIRSGVLSGNDLALAYNKRGNAYANMGQHERAIQDYDQAIKQQPTMPWPYNNRGNAYRRLGQLDRALLDYDQATKLKPDYHYPFVNRGTVYNSKRQHERAIQEYDQAIKLKADYAEAFVGRGFAYSFKGQFDRAMPDFDQAIKLKPDYAAAFYGRGHVHRRRGQLDAAIVEYSAALKFNPTHAYSLYGRGLARRQKGDATGGEADIAAAKAIQSNVADEFR